MSDRVLVAFDGSEPAQEALEHAFEHFPDAEVTALYVVSIPEGYFETLSEAEGENVAVERAREHGEEILKQAEQIAHTHDRVIDTELVTGTPDREIVSQATERNFDVIVIGSHGREGVSRAFLGSVAEKVVRRSSIPVFVIE